MIDALLEQLSTEELLLMADEAGLDIPPEVDRRFIIGELAEQAGQDAGAAADAPAAGRGKAPREEAAPLPENYNISFISAIPRDPLWVFVFWEIRQSDQETFLKDPAFGGFYLKVTAREAAPEAAETPASPDGDAAFFVPVGDDDRSWYLGFQPRPGRRCEITLCAVRGDEELFLASTGLLDLPDMPDRGGPCAPLAFLSGAADIPRQPGRAGLSRAARSLTPFSREDISKG